MLVGRHPAWVEAVADVGVRRVDVNENLVLDARPGQGFDRLDAVGLVDPQPARLGEVGDEPDALSQARWVPAAQERPTSCLVPSSDGADGGGEHA